METNLTPFEKAAVGRARSSLVTVTHMAVEELLKQLNECDVMIDMWHQQVLVGNSSEATLRLATQALKDKKLFEEALIQITISAGRDLGLEA